jgi:hypothetical protein
MMTLVKDAMRIAGGRDGVRATAEVRIEIAVCLVELHLQQARLRDACVQTSAAAVRSEFVEENAAPFQAVYGQQQRHPLADVSDVRQGTTELCGKLPALFLGDGQIGLTQKIADQFDGVVPSGIFEVDEISGGPDGAMCCESRNRTVTGWA